MKNRLKFIFFIAAITVGGIMLCQFYWVYFNYKTAKANFNETVNFALRTSLDEYQLSQNTLPTSLRFRKPSFTFFMRTIPEQDPIALDTPNTKRRFNAEFSTVSVDSDQLPQVKALIARLLSQQKHKSINLDSLSVFFKRALSRVNIQEDFALSIQRNPREYPAGAISAKVNFYKDPMLVNAELAHPNAFIFRHNFAPAIVSSFLILLSAASLFYMGRIIRRQMLLDSVKTDFINNITHELRTPITILKSSNEALSKFGAADNAESLSKHLKINETVLDNLETSVERILEFSKFEQSKIIVEPETVDLTALIKDITLKFSVIENLEIKVDYDYCPFEVLSVGSMLEAIILNLLDNAIKYSPGFAHITIGLHATTNKWHLIIRDEGLGISKADQAFIFDKFYRVNTGDVQNVKGYGIGLSYVQQIVKALSGEIELMSEVNKGTSFKITFDKLWKK